MLGFSNPIHIAFILVLLLLVFGAKRLPEMGRSLGSGLRGFKDTIGGEESTPALSVPDSAAHVDRLTVPDSAAHVEVLSAVRAPAVPERTAERIRAQPVA